MSLHAQAIDLNGRIQVESFRVDQGECVVLCGPNGSGKSSLLRLLAGVERAALGHVSCQGQDLGLLSPDKRAALIAWLPQRSMVSSGFTVEALVATSRYRFFESRAVAEEKAVELLKSHGLAKLAGRLASQISGGELQRVLIVSLVAQQASWLMLDEPANHLDPKHQIEAYQSLGKLWQMGHGVIIVSHDVRLAQLLGDSAQVRVVGIKSGLIAFEKRLADTDLFSALSDLYETPYVPPGQAGGLALDLGLNSLFTRDRS